MFKNTATRRGTAIAAAALSVALVAPSITPAGAETPASSSAAAATTTTTESAVSTTTSTSTKVETSTSTATSTTTPATTTPATTTATKAAGTATDLSSGRSDKCNTTLIAAGVPLAALIPLGLLSQVAIGSSANFTNVINHQIREVNAEIQRQAGVLNPDLAAAIASADKYLQAFGYSVASAAVGLAALAGGLTAASFILKDCVIDQQAAGVTAIVSGVVPTAIPTEGSSKAFNRIKAAFAPKTTTSGTAETKASTVTATTTESSTATAVATETSTSTAATTVTESVKASEPAAATPATTSATK